MIQQVDDTLVAGDGSTRKKNKKKSKKRKNYMRTVTEESEDVTLYQANM